MNGSHWDAFLIWALCRNELHDLALARSGNCLRCGLYITKNGHAL